MAHADADRLPQRPPAADARARRFAARRAAKKLRPSSSIATSPNVRSSIASGALAADQRMARHRVVAQRPAADPLLVAARVDLLGVHAHREHPADERAHAHAGDAVDRRPRRPSSSSSTPMCEKRARAAAGQDDADRAARQAAGHPGDAASSVAPCRRACVSLGSSACAQAASAPDPCATSQATRSQPRSSGRGAAAGGGSPPRADGEDAVGLLEAELGPGIAVEGRCRRRGPRWSFAASARSSSGAYAAAGSPPSAGACDSVPSSRATAPGRPSASREPPARSATGTASSSATSAIVTGSGRTSRAAPTLSRS